MKNKIMGIFVCMLLIATILPVAGTQDEKTISTKGGIDFIPVLDLIDIKGGLFSISVNLTNFGEGTADNIYWRMNASGGIFFFPKSINGEIDELNPG